MKKIIILAFSLVLFACNSETTNEAPAPAVQQAQNKAATPINKQLNITIVLDLSDRIDPKLHSAHPEHANRDIEIVKYFTQLFKDDMEARGAFNAKGKIKVILSPAPNVDDINTIISQLNVDLSQVSNNKEKKKVFDSITTDFEKNLEVIYEKTIKTKKYLGADVWRFFKNDVVDYSVENSNEYRNILVLITDGYLYHQASRDVIGNRSAYLTSRFINKAGLRKSSWLNTFNDGDYGFITKRTDLDSLDVLVLEITPSTKHKNDEDVIKQYLSKWFTEMNVNSFKLYNTDLPKYTKGRIKKFITQ